MATPFNSPVKPPSKLTRTQTPVPEAFLSHFTFQEATLKGATVANTLLNKDLTLSSPLCRDINTDSTMQDDNDDNDDDSDEEDNNNDDDEGDRATGRERTLSIIDLDNAPSTNITINNNDNSGSPRALAMQADKKSKRVRVDASATNIKKTVRFDESKNTEHPHYSDSESSIAFRASTSAFATRPVVSALVRRQTSSSSSPPDVFNSTRTSFSPFTFGNIPTNNSDTNNNNNNNNNNKDASSNQFSLSLENTSQEVMDFASSLNRLMGGSSVDSSNSSSTNFQSSFGSPSRSPLSFSPSFQNSPPSPVRPMTMSAYSPPVASSLSSCWSPTLESDKDEDEVMSSQPLSPPRPVSRRQSSSSSAKFTPRRPRISTPLRPLQQQSSSSAGVRPRFPSMLKREASNASFLDNYPSSLVADDEEPSLSPASVAPPVRLSDLQSNSNSIAPNHAVIAAAVLNIPSLTKSVSDVSSSKSSFQFDTTTSSSQLKRSSSWDFGQQQQQQQQQQNTNAGAPLAPLSFGSPLFSMAPNMTRANNSIFPTPPDSQHS
ncbi:hypothetical protein BGX20_003757 [Mortierella sp. AD010]|nr:hypothetical protein BGX20_003757 [Mortierella sp. AD010]